MQCSVCCDCKHDIVKVIIFTFIVHEKKNNGYININLYLMALKKDLFK